MNEEIMRKILELETRMKRIEKLLSNPSLETLNNNLHIIADEIRRLK